MQLRKIYYLAAIVLLKATFSYGDSLNVLQIGGLTYGKCRAVVTTAFNGHTYSVIGCGWGIMIINVDDPCNPVKIGESQTAGSVQKIYAQDSIIYIAAAEQGLRIFNISNPSLPYEIGYYDTDGTANDVVVLGQYAYMADGNAIKIINISNPTNPSEVGSYSCPANGIDVNGYLAYVASGFDGLRIISLHDSLDLQQTGIINTPSRTLDVHVIDTLAYVADDYGGLRVINIADSAHPVEIGYNDSAYSVETICINNGYAYTVNGYIGELNIFNISNPLHPILVSSYKCDLFPFDIDIVGQYAFIAGCNGLLTIDLSNISTPLFGALYKTPSFANDINISGNKAYIADYYSGVRILDISNPNEPQDLSLTEDPVWIEYLTIFGKFAYATGYDGLNVIDISNPSLPVKIGSCNCRGRIAVKNDYAYVTVDKCIQVVDISDSTNPFIANIINTPDCPQRAIISDTLLFVACGPYYDMIYENYGGLRVYNISNPAMPVQVGYLNTQPEYITNLSISNNLAYLSKNGFYIVDISNPFLPSIIGEYTTTSQVEDIKSNDKFVYLANGNYVRVIDITNTSNPYEVGYYAFPNLVRAIEVINDTIFAATREYGFEILQAYGVAGVSNKEIIPAFPNKYSLWFNGNRLFYKVDKTVNVKIKIYNMLGQTVKTIDKGPTIKGTHYEQIKGLASGVYFVKMQADNTNILGKIVLIK